MRLIFNKEEAKQYYAENDGVITCENIYGEQKECESYAEAEEFFDFINHNRRDGEIIRLSMGR